MRSTKPVRLAELVLAIAVLSLTAATAAPARADATDDAFLAALASKGINFESPESAIGAAHEVCNELRGGRSKIDVANEIMRSSNLDGYHAGYFVGVSVRAYCPNFAG